MNRQHYDLLTKLIYASGTSFPQNVLAQILDVSPRSIRNYITTINEFLDDNELHLLQTLPNGDVVFTGSQQDVIEIQQHLLHSDFYQYRLSAEERKQVLNFLFLTSEGYITSNELSERLYVSKTTLVKDMDEVSGYFAKRGVSFCDAKTAGYCLEIDEWKRRELLMEQMDHIVLRQYVLSDSAIGASTGAIYGFVMQLFSGIERMTAMQNAVYRAEKETGIQLNDREFQSIIHGLIILLTRLNRQLLVPEPCNGLFEALGIAERLSYSLSHQLAHEFDLGISAAEQIYMAYALEHQWLDRKDRDPFNALEVQLATKRFIYAVSKDLGLELFHDNELQRFLANHLQSLLASGHGHSVSQETFNHVESQYQDCSTAVERNLPLLGNVLGGQDSRFESHTVLLYITAAVERLRRKQGAPKAIIVCNSGIATAKFLSEKLLRNFNIDVVSTTSALRLEQVRLHCQHDFIITTVPLQVTDIPCVWVSPMLTRKDMIQIYDILNALDNRVGQSDLLGNDGPPSAESGHNMLRDVFPLERVMVNCHVDTWQEAIWMAGRLLPGEDRAVEQYVADMIRCVEENGPYIVIVPGVALAHAAPPAPDIPFCASIACFASPVAFYSSDNDPVWCVIALQATNKEEHTRKLLQVMNLACNMEFRQLARCGSKQELIEFIYGFCTDRKDKEI